MIDEQIGTFCSWLAWDLLDDEQIHGFCSYRTVVRGICEQNQLFCSREDGKGEKLGENRKEGSTDQPMSHLWPGMREMSLAVRAQQR